MAEADGQLQPYLSSKAAWNQTTNPRRSRLAYVKLTFVQWPQPSALLRDEIDVGLLLPPVQTDGIQLDELWCDP